MMENVLEIKDLIKTFKGFTLKDVTFQLPQGYIMGLIGPNGAGKTTIIKLIMNLILRNSGEIRVFGKDNLKHEAEIKSRIGFVYDVPHYYEDVNLKDIKSSIAPFYEKWDEPLFRSLIDEFDLPLKKKFKKLSHGMKMKFSLALALSHNADLILMDEPTSGLDPVFRRELLEKLSELMQSEHKSILFSTHITSDLERIADYITFINNGEIVFSSTKDQVLRDWCIVKGDNELLNKETRGMFQGIRSGEYGFEALTSNIKEAKRYFREKTIFEKAASEDILFFISRGEKNV